MSVCVCEFNFYGFNCSQQDLLTERAKNISFFRVDFAWQTQSSNNNFYIHNSACCSFVITYRIRIKNERERRESNDNKRTKEVKESSTKMS